VLPDEDVEVEPGHVAVGDVKHMLDCVSQQ
jgi:hypothetical protein